MNANEYNAKYVPLFAPDGFSERYDRLNRPDPASDEFAEHILDVQHDLGLREDGFCGPSTISAIARDMWGYACYEPDQSPGIVIGPQAHKVDAPVITHLDDFTLGDTSSRVRKHAVRQMVLHYDVSFNARATEEILEKRGYSTHFIIDGDDKGTIYQCHDPATKVALHAGSPNPFSIGIDLNNPADTSYQQRDTARRGRERPIVKQKIHGRMVHRLDYHPEQIQSLISLLEVLCQAFGVPMACPRDSQGDAVLGLIDNDQLREFQGVVGHYHWSSRKTDPSPLNWDEVFTDSQESPKS